MHQRHQAGISQAVSRARTVLLLAAIALLIATIGAASLSLGTSSVAAQIPTPVSPVPIQPDRDGDSHSWARCPEFDPRRDLAQISRCLFEYDPEMLWYDWTML